MTTLSICPCGSQKTYAGCCGQYHKNIGSAPTAEALMRSRYSAFALHNIDYIRATQRLDKDPAISEDDELDDSEMLTNWMGLEILDTEQGQEGDDIGTVTFRAHFQEGQHKGELSEKSQFTKDNGRWLYISGEHDIASAPASKTKIGTKTTVGRNDPCSCGSGKKSKKCCA